MELIKFYIFYGYLFYLFILGSTESTKLIDNQDKNVVKERSKTKSISKKINSHISSTLHRKMNDSRRKENFSRKKMSPKSSFLIDQVEDQIIKPDSISIKMFNSSEISKSSKATEIDFINKENEKPVLPIKDHNSQNFTNSKDFININDDTNKHSVSNTTDSLKESNGLDFKNVNITNENIIEEVLVIKENITNAIKPTILLDNDDNKKIKNQMLDSNVENIFPLKGEINSKEIVLQTFDFDKENVMTKSFDKNLSTTTIIPIDISINISTNDIKTGETIKIVLEDDTTTIKTTSTTTEKEMTEKNILVTTETNKDSVTKSPKSTFIVVKVVNNKIVEERIFETEDEVKRIVFTTTTTTTTTTLAPTTTKEAKITTQVIPPAPITKKQNKASSLKQPSPPSSRPPSDEIIKKLNAAVDFIAMAKDLGIFHETQN